MRRFILLLCTSSGFIFSMDKPLVSDNTQSQTTQTVQQPQEKKDSNNIWDRVNPADKAYPGEYAPAWGWVLTDWGD